MNELWKLSGTLGIESLNSQIELNMYPNPANELLFINAEESVTLTLMNLNGQILKTFESAMAHQVDVSSLSQGMYLIGVNGTQQIHRFVKQ